MQTIILKSTSSNPWYNLALEELLIQKPLAGNCILLLWKNNRTVCIGKNQNPWLECHIGALKNQTVKLSRRLSGGGTVFHDPGNLNFSFITSRNAMNPDMHFSILLSALQKLGIQAYRNDRNDILVGTRKISGNAFCYKKNTALHHGTLLINADLSRMHGCLKPANTIRESKSIPSVRSEVMNLTEADNSITDQKVIEALTVTFQEKYPYCAERIYAVDSLDDELFCELYKKYASWEWQFGCTPRFELILASQFSWGPLWMCFTVDKGRIIDTAIQSPDIDTVLSERISDTLRDCLLISDLIASNLYTISCVYNDQKLIDIANWMSQKEL